MDRIAFALPWICITQIARPAELGLLAGELAHVGVALAEQVGAAGQVLHVPLVDLFRGNRDRLVLVGLQICRPRAQGADVVLPQRLDPGDVEPGLGGVLLDLRHQREPTAGVNFVKDESDERISDIVVGS